MEVPTGNGSCQLFENSVYLLDSFISGFKNTAFDSESDLEVVGSGTILAVGLGAGEL